MLLTVISSQALASKPVDPVAPTRAEMRSIFPLRPNAAAPHFSFVYGEVTSNQLLKQWRRTIKTQPLDPARKQTTIEWRSPDGLVVTQKSVSYSDYPAVEWVITVRNSGSSDSKLLHNIRALDTSMSSNSTVTLHGVKGDFCAAESYEPYDLTLAPGTSRSFSPPPTGKSCDGPNGWPYFNLQIGDGGLILAVGWPGHWSANFARDKQGELRVDAGQQSTHMILHPGEEVRTPLVALLAWSGGDSIRAQNLWRRWYLSHVLPVIDGKPQTPLTQIQVDGSVANIADVKAVLDAGIRPDVAWRDAGGPTTWYPNRSGPYKGNDAWLNTGTWEVDTARYPQGFKPFSDWLHTRGISFLLWFEPERVGDPNSWIAVNHPEWLLPGSSHGGILNLGNAAARKWLTDHVDSMIHAQGLDWYREDMNGVGPYPAWKQADAPDRQGVTENFYVQGHLAFWDELKRRNPHLRIDSCASGGRRNDLETMRRAVPLLRSDFQFPDMPGVVEGNQAHTWGLSNWLPYQGTGCYFPDIYSLRSFYLPAYGTVGTSSVQKQAYQECARIAPLMLGDYYPLTPYSRDTEHWIAWQFNRPDNGDGVVQAFRRSQCPSTLLKPLLHGLEPEATYCIEDIDSHQVTLARGKDLMAAGLTIELANRPAAAILIYRKQ